MLEKNKYLPFILLFLLVFISRLPFLMPGFGIEEDSWGIALAALHTHASGVYEPSRFPGHPVQELPLSALVLHGAVLFNLLSALFSAIAVLFFALILRHLRFRHFFIAALAFAFVPVFYISSTYTIDFVWTEAFVLISFYLLLKRRLIAAGVFLGLAVGCRITSGVMLLPFMLILWEHGNVRGNMLKLVKLAVPMGAVAFIAFFPLLRQFGLSFFMYYDQFPYPPVAKVLYKMIPGVFGFIGTLALGYAALKIMLRKRGDVAGKLVEEGIDKKIISASILILVLFIIAYFRLPQKSGYMIPLIPFLIILAGACLNSRDFRIVCAAFILSSFVCSINLTDKLRGAEYSAYAIKFSVSGQEIFFDPFSGPVFSDHSKRKQKMNYAVSVLRKVPSLKQRTVIISGWWYNQLQVMNWLHTPDPMVVYEPYIPESKIKEYIAGGYRVMYLPEQETCNDLMYGITSTASLAVPF